MRVLLLGGNGQVGREVTLAAAGDATSTVLAPPRQAVDLADPAAVTGAVRDAAPDVVINAAAYTAVDRAEGDEAAAFAANATGPGHLAAACAAVGVPLLHLSTDYVFDGTRTGAYVEDDPVRPLGVYGASKEAGERAIRAALDRHVIIRTSWVFSRHGNNFVRTMLRLGAERPELRVVADQVGRPTAARDIAVALSSVARRVLATGSDGPWGTYHFSGAGRTTWHGFAEEIFAVRRRLTGAEPPVVHPITTAEYPTPARRPANSELDCARIAAGFGVVPPDWRIALEADVAALLAEMAPAGSGSWALP